MKIEDRNIRYYVDLDLKTKEIIELSFGNKFQLITEKLQASIHRTYLTKGQYQKLRKKLLEFNK